MNRPQPSDDADGLVWASHRTLMTLKKEGEAIPLRAISVRSLNAGSHLSRFRGRGMEFDEARPYQPGDDVRSIDWRVTARRGKPHTKLFREERERAVICWVDFRTPMRFGTRGMFKSVLAARAAALLGWSARAHGERLGLLAFSEQLHRELRPVRGDRGIMRSIALLSDFSREPCDFSTPDARRDAVENALIRLRRVAMPGSLVFMISDFRGLSSCCEHHFRALAPHSDLVLLQVHDPLEARLPQSGQYRVRGQRRSLILDADDPQRRARHEEQFQRHRDALENLCRRNRMHLLSCDTSQDLFTSLREGLGRRPR